MKDPIIEGYLQEFSNNFKINNLSLADKFEYLVNFCILNSEKYDEFEIEDVHVGEQGNYGLDGVAILIDGELVTSEEEVDAILSKKRNSSVTYIFVQTKTSASFDSGDMLKEFSAIKAFLNNDRSVNFNAYCKNLMKVGNYIFKQGSKISEEIVCKIYYATTGIWNENNFSALVNQEKKQIESYGIFKHIEFIPLGGDDIKKKYREICNTVTKDIDFVRKATLPNIDGIESSFIGILEAKRYIDLITDSSGNIIKNIFFENIRDFLGDNIVNVNIAETLSGAYCELFPVLNNGVTIVAKKLKSIGDRISLSNFQVVNGCQTSHILFKNKEKLTDSIFLPIKLIATEDDDIISKIIMATNNQTEIKKEAFEALRPFHKELEEYYKVASQRYNVILYYERRQKQYLNTDIDQHQIVTLSRQTKSYIATFLNCPHSMHKYYGKLIEDFHAYLYKEGQNLFPYYLSTALNYKLANILSRHTELRYYKFYIQYALKILTMGEDKIENKKDNNPKGMDNLITIFSNDTLLEKTAICIAKKMNEIVVEMDTLPHLAIRRKDFTDRVDKMMLDISRHLSKTGTDKL